MNPTNENPFTMEKALKKRKLNGITMFAIVFTLFVLILGITAGITYSGFQSTAQSDGTLTFAVNGHQGTLTLSNTKVASYNSEDLILTFTLASETGYSTPNISGITMGSTNLTKDGNNFKNSTIIVATYSAPTLTIYRANVTGNLEVTGSSIASTYTVSIVSNNASYGTVSQASVTNVPYGTGISTGNNSNSNQITINGTTITATPTEASGYTTAFSGWTIPSGEITGNTTITANFTRTENPVSYIISLDNQSADTTGTIAVSPTGSTLPNITVPTKSGCQFGGYYTSQYGAGTKYYNADGTPATTWSGSSNITLYAKWMSYIELTSSTNNVSLRTNNNAKNWNGTLEYCLSTPTNSTTWTTWTGTTTIGGSTHTIYLRGTGNTYLTSGSFSSASSRYWVISCASNDVACNGNIMSLLDCTKASLGASITMGDHAFAYLFGNCANLVSAPELPATTLVSGCYYYMFNGCTSLVSAPELPATTLVSACYRSMFNGCTSLVNAPVLPATTLATSCYIDMFNGCTSLVTAPALPATTLEQSCYSNMFNGCTSLVTAPALPATTLADGCYQSMFNGCTSLTTAPALPATTLEQNCYFCMFSGCTSLVTAPALPSTTLLSQCYYQMFNGCTSLVNAPALSATTLANYCYQNMFYGCASLVNAPELPATTLSDYCYREMFYGCASLVNAPATLPATTLLSECYTSMFSGCTSLVNAPALPATALANNCYYYMFNGCTSLVNAPALPATTLANNCYYYMFNGCTSLVKAPALPATTLANNCYYYMFYGCTSLEVVPTLTHVTTWASACCYNMFRGCTKVKVSNSNTDDYIRPLLTTGSTTSYFSNMFSSTGGTFTGSPVASTTYYTSNDVILPSGEVDAGNCIHFSSPNEFCLKANTVGWNGTLEYRTTGAWATWDGSAIVANSIYLRGTGNNKIGGNSTSYRWTLIGSNISCNGNIENLLDYSAVALGNHPNMNSYAFAYLFYNCSSLVNAPSLPATDLTGATYCYSMMFSGCTSLITAPALPATTLAIYCYYCMFSGCSSLTTAPSSLPATTLATSCYYRMFYSCSSLVSAPSLPATTLAGSCYFDMFSGCHSLVNAPELPATTLASSCYYSMFSGCRSLTTAPLLPATSLASQCYYSMFAGCRSLTTAPSLPATSLAESCYQSMFANCTGLITAPALSVTTLEQGCYLSMFQNCTSLVTAPALPATTLANSCYYMMFEGCTSLVNAPALPATTLENSCYYRMFYSCSSLITAPALPATTLAQSCYQYMFYGCTSLTTAPALPANALANYCYSNMFSGCTNLEVIPSLAHVTTWATNCCQNMFISCTKVKVSNSNTGAYTTPLLTTGSTASYFSNMFTNTGGSFKSSPAASTTYYTSNEVVLPPPTFATATWAQIKEIAQAGGEKEDGSGTYGFAVGDTRTIEIDGNNYTIRIADIIESGQTERYYYTEGGDTIYVNMVFELCEILEYSAMGTGWPLSWADCNTMRTLLSDTNSNASVYNRLPSGLKMLLEPLISVNNSSSTCLANDYLFLPSTEEITSVGYKFDYYTTNSANSDRVKTSPYVTPATYNNTWWLRDASYAGVDYTMYYYINTDGTMVAGEDIESQARGVSFCFAF